MIIKKILVENSLSLVLFLLFLIFLIGQSIAGYSNFNQDQLQHGGEVITYSNYLLSPQFISSVFENWESEFLQMGSYILLTVWLRQKGSAESKKLVGREEVDADPEKFRSAAAPGPVKLGGWWLAIYANSLSMIFFLLFAFSFRLHFWGSLQDFNEEQLMHGGEVIGALDYLSNAQFWFESLQNWQSEFLAVWAIVVFSIFLRQKGSPESKPVSAPHDETGS